MPRSTKELLELWYGPDGTPIVGSSSSTQASPDGEPADTATVDEIEAAVQEWASCNNAGDYARIYALMTDDLAQTMGLQRYAAEEARDMLSSPPSALPQEEWRSFGSARNAVMWPDGRVSANFRAVGLQQPGVAMTTSVIFVEQNGRWLLDGMRTLIVPEPTAPVWSYQVVAEYPHDPDAYTQGLLINDGQLYEGTGRYGESGLRRVEMETGEVLQSHSLSEDYFGEGIAAVDDRIYQLTWLAGTGFVYDMESFTELETFSYPTQGWGLTYDGDRLIMSDGTSRIFFRNPETFEEIGVIEVHDDGLPVSNLNELEYINGEIWANIYTTDWIVRIDPLTGAILSWIDMSGLLPAEAAESDEVDVLNGIAYDPVADRLLVTGKLWPTMFEIEVIPPQ